MDLFVKRFQETVLDCCDTIDEETMVDVCLHDMANEYRVFLENPSFPSFSKLMGLPRELMNLSEERHDQALEIIPNLGNHLNPVVRPFLRKRPIMASVEIKKLDLQE